MSQISDRPIPIVGARHATVRTSLIKSNASKSRDASDSRDVSNSRDASNSRDSLNSRVTKNNRNASYSRNDGNSRDATTTEEPTTSGTPATLGRLAKAGRLTIAGTPAIEWARLATVRISLIRSDDSNGMSTGRDAIATADPQATAGRIPQQEVNHSRRLKQQAFKITYFWSYAAKTTCPVLFL
jgi:hypothetical protein